jgi:protein-S-isoprenylcysteine O-methyltransferase Ste14
MAVPLRTRAAIQSFSLFALLALLVLLPAGTVRYWQAWAYVGIFVVASTSITGYLLKHDPALLERRLAIAEKGEPEPRQKVIQAILGPAFFLMLLVAGLDLRFGWSHVPFAAVVVAELVVVAAFVVVFFVFRENTFSSSIVEVTARQRVVSSGPYRLVRHPMYSGGLLLLLATPVSLGSWWAELLVVPLSVGIVVRLLDEERLLSERLPGYRNYMAETRSRLVPRIW